jgi:hypothetical protein
MIAVCKSENDIKTIGGNSAGQYNLGYIRMLNEELSSIKSTQIPLTDK